MRHSLPIFRLGLTGGIGSGKSTVAKLLAARGAAVVDADAIARSVTARNGSAMRFLIPKPKSGWRPSFTHWSAKKPNAKPRRP